MATIFLFSAAMMMLLIATVPPVTLAPLSEMKHVTLHVQSEILDGHKIVITLEPLANSSKKDLPVEFHDTTNVSVINQGKSVQADKSEDSTELPPNSTSSTTSEIETSSVTANPDIIVVSALPPVDGVDSFIVKFPDIKCLPGQKHDANGKCREMFTLSRLGGKSMDSFNFVLDNSSRVPKKYWKKFGWM